MTCAWRTAHSFQIVLKSVYTLHFFRFDVLTSANSVIPCFVRRYLSGSYVKHFSILLQGLSSFPRSFFLSKHQLLICPLFIWLSRRCSHHVLSATFPPVLPWHLLIQVSLPSSLFLLGVSFLCQLLPVIKSKSSQVTN